MTTAIEDSNKAGKVVEVVIPPETLTAFQGDELRARVFYEKYALRDASGKQIEKTPEQMWRRVAVELASVEKSEKKKEWTDKFYWLLEDFKFVPGGRILFGAGQPRRSTLLNCLDGDTEVLIRDTVEYKSQKLGYSNSLLMETAQLVSSVTKAKIRDIIGKKVEILTLDGWKSVIFTSFGAQPVYRVSLRNGDEFVATANHEWPVFYRTKQRPSKVTTLKLKGKSLFISLPGRPEINQDYFDGVTHGIIFGDGSKNSAATTYSIYLFGAQRDLVHYLKDYGHVTEYAGDDPALKGAVFVGGIRSRFNLKETPSPAMSASYWYGFVCGLIATDGHCSTAGQMGIDNHDRRDLERIREQVVRVGMFPNTIFISRRLNPFNGQESPLYRFTISKFSLREEDFLRTDHRRKFAGRKTSQKIGNHIRVKDAVALNEEREVYCCTEPVTHTFTIGNGILTGNCYFFKIKEDSIEGIFDWCKESARTYSFGGGVGTDISILRPKGSPVNNAAIYSSGSVSFMELLSTTTGTIGQAGRRGALMITVRVDHPDVVDFINVKKDLKKVNYANISVKLTDDFMKAVENDDDFELHFKNEKVEVRRKVRARDIWNELTKAAWQSDEPGVLFWDTIKRESTTEYNGMEVEGVNPCVTGDTLVLTPSGWRRANSLNQGDKIVTAYGTVKPITKIEKHEDIDVFRVEFSDGGSIKVSPGHVFHSRKGQGRNADGWTKFWNKDATFSELKAGDLVRLAKIQSPPQNEVDTWGVPDRDFGFMIGVLLGDGSITEKVLGNDQAKIASDKREKEWNDYLVTKFEAIAPSMRISADKRTNGCYIYLYKQGSDFIREHTLLTPAKASDKEVPVEYINSNKTFHSGLIDGLISTDGDIDMNASNPSLRLSSTSRKLLEDVRLILHFYGINARIYRTMRKDSKRSIFGRVVVLNHDSYGLHVFGNDLKRFAEIFTVSHPEKKRKLERIKDMVTGSVSDSTRIKSIEYVGKERVYDIYERETDTWITNGYVSRGCSEQTLESYGCCCLGSVNLSYFVKEPFTDHSSIDWDALVKASQYAVRFLDNVLDYNAEKHPLPQQKKASLWSRRIGVGITGLGDMLIKLGLKYDEDATIEFVDKLFERITNIIYDYSTELAKEKTSFPALEAEKHLAQPFIQRLDPKIKEKIKEYGIRNAAITTIPPVGSGSILAGCSSGIEPVFALYYTRRSKSLSEGEFKVFHPLVKEHMLIQHITDEKQLPSYFITAHQIKPEMRVKMQAAIQKHIDTAISSTVNLPEDISVEEVQRIYFLAWKMGCFLKGNDVYTKDGLKDISEIDVGHLVLSHDGQYHRVTEVYRLPPEVRRFVRLDIQGMEDLVATAEHPILVLRPTARHWQKKVWKEQEHRLMWLKITDVRVDDHVVLPKFRFDNERIREISVSDHASCLVRDGYAYPCRTLPWKKEKSVIAAHSNGIKNTVHVDEDLVWFLGWFVAEGHFSGKSYVRMTLNPDETGIADRLEKIVFEKFGLRSRREMIHSGGASLRLQWASAIFNQFLEKLVGRGARNKHLPAWFTRISPDLLEIMVKAWSSGDSDGTVNGGVTTSQRLCREMFMIQAQLSTLTMRVSQNKSGLYRITEGSGNYIGKQWNNFMCYRVRGKSEFCSSEQVYNFAVEGADSYVVNGATVHNCKGITVYREGSREGILETFKVEKKEDVKSKEFERPRVMSGRTLKLKLPQGGLYVTANADETGTLKEVFVTLGKLGGDEKADAEAIGRLISLYLQHGGDVQNVIKMLKGIRGKYVSWDDGIQLLSIPDAVSKTIEMLVAGKVKKEPVEPMVRVGTCPDCQENSIIFENGCYKCINCGYSKCE
jgi:ribonucleoside-diphosphate reductase alpha chain